MLAYLSRQKKKKNNNLRVCEIWTKKNHHLFFTIYIIYMWSKCFFTWMRKYFLWKNITIEILFHEWVHYVFLMKNHSGRNAFWCSKLPDLNVQGESSKEELYSVHENILFIYITWRYVLRAKLPHIQDTHIEEESGRTEDLLVRSSIHTFDNRGSLRCDFTIDLDYRIISMPNRLDLIERDSCKLHFWISRLPTTWWFDTTRKRSMKQWYLLIKSNMWSCK